MASYPVAVKTLHKLQMSMALEKKSMPASVKAAVAPCLQGTGPTGIQASVTSEYQVLSTQRPVTMAT